MRTRPIRGLYPRVPPAAAEPQPLRPIRAWRAVWHTRSVPATSLILPLRHAAATAAPNSNPSRGVASWEQAGGTSCCCPANTGHGIAIHVFETLTRGCLLVRVLSESALLLQADYSGLAHFPLQQQRSAPGHSVLGRLCPSSSWSKRPCCQLLHYYMYVIT